MSSARRAASRLALAVAISALPLASADAAEDSAPPQSRYEKALQLYSDGKLREAQAAFASLARDYPNHEAARTAVVRIQNELDPDGPMAWVHSPSVHEESSLEDAFDNFLLDSIPRCLRFERTLGDARARVGTLQACQGRIDQLLAERRLARKLKRTFRRDKELRALVRRMPSLNNA
jgi:hypothetical protein